MSIIWWEQDWGHTSSTSPWTDDGLVVSFGTHEDNSSSSRTRASHLKEADWSWKGRWLVMKSVENENWLKTLSGLQDGRARYQRGNLSDPAVVHGYVVSVERVKSYIIRKKVNQVRVQFTHSTTYCILNGSIYFLCLYTGEQSDEMTQRSHNCS